MRISAADRAILFLIDGCLCTMDATKRQSSDILLRGIHPNPPMCIRHCKTANKYLENVEESKVSYSFYVNNALSLYK